MRIHKINIFHQVIFYFKVSANALMIEFKIQITTVKAFVIKQQRPDIQDKNT